MVNTVNMKAVSEIATINIKFLSISFHTFTNIRIHFRLFMLRIKTTALETI